ncbi:MAG: carbohydrate ABC transporter permease [bacterium]|nr:carbohydrate ABC transporter permease [bacterium]
MDIFSVEKKDKRIMRIMLFAAAILWIFPAYSAISRSLLFAGLDNYRAVFTDKIAGTTIYRTLFNSFLVASIHSVIVVSVASISGYAFSKMKFWGRKPLYIMTISLMAVPVTVIIAPLFYSLSHMKLINTYAAIFLPEAALTLPFSVLMMRNFFDSLPDELMESGFIDGANHFKIFSYIYLPLALPALLNLAVLAFMWSFKDYLNPALFTSNPKIMTATLAISRFQDSLGGTPRNVGRYFAALVVISIPIIIVFSYLQKFMRSGILSGSVKE